MTSPDDPAPRLLTPGAATWWRRARLEVDALVAERARRGHQVAPGVAELAARLLTDLLYVADRYGIRNDAATHLHLPRAALDCALSEAKAQRQDAARTRG